MSHAREAFLAEAAPRWRQLAALLPADVRLRGLAPADISRLAALYRSLCADLSRAQSLGCSADVVAHLDGLAARAHNALYAGRARRGPGAAEVLLHAFPRHLRESRRFVLVAAVAFFAPLALGVTGALVDPDFATNVVPAATLEQLVEAYGEGFGGGRAESTDVGMTGFYVNNNVGIAFRCFATGILFGLGSLFFLVYNGLVTGAVIGYVASHGAGAHLLTFIAGHGSFELTAIVIAGAAGLRLGWALIETHGMSRVASLRAQAPALVALVSGAAAMLVVAALIEGFWSPSGVAAEIKWAAAALFALVVLAFLLFAGRGPRRRRTGPRHPGARRAA